MESKPRCPVHLAEGAMLALAAGDALGWPVENRSGRVGGSGTLSKDFRDWTRRTGGRFYAHEEDMAAGSYSDDTQLAVAVARSLREGGERWWHWLTKCELPLWTLYQRGGGGATLRATKAWASQTPPWAGNSPDDNRRYFMAGGNGVVMRVLPHVLWGYGQDPEQVVRQVLRDGITTHGHPRALVGAAVFAVGAHWLLHQESTMPYAALPDALLASKEVWSELPAPSGDRSGWAAASDLGKSGSYRQEWEKVVQEMLSLLNAVRSGVRAGPLADDHRALADLGCFERSVQGAGTVTCAVAVYLMSRYASEPVNGVMQAAHLPNSDADTNAAVTGALLGCLWGSDWLPREWLEVQDAGFLRSIATSMCQEPRASGSAVEFISPQKVRTAVVDAKLGDTVRLGCLGSGAVHAIDEMRSRTRSTTTTRWCLKVGGQTFFIKKSSKSAPTHQKEERQREREADGPPPRPTALSDGQRAFLDALEGDPVKRREFIREVGEWLALHDRSSGFGLADSIVPAALVEVLRSRGVD